MKTEVIPLGTASAAPAFGRHLSALAIQRAGHIFLFDCGEGTQFQLQAAGLSPSKIEAIFITHLHGDHFFGLMGLLTSLAMNDRSKLLTLVAPAGLMPLLRSIPGLRDGDLTFPVESVPLEQEVGDVVVFEDRRMAVEARPVEHRVFTVGYRYREKPRPGSLDVERARALGIGDYEQFRALKRGEAVQVPDGSVVQPEDVVGPEKPGCAIAYVTDTRPCAEGIALAGAVDLLYHEATFSRQHQRQAVDTGHSTAQEAASVAAEAGVHRLLLGHFSARYPDPAPLVAEARAVFQNTEAAEELRRYVVSPGESTSTD